MAFRTVHNLIQPLSLPLFWKFHELSSFFMQSGLLNTSYVNSSHSATVPSLLFPHLGHQYPLLPLHSSLDTRGLLYFPSWDLEKSPVHVYICSRLSMLLIMFIPKMLVVNIYSLDLYNSGISHLLRYTVPLVSKDHGSNTLLTLSRIANYYWEFFSVSDTVLNFLYVLSYLFCEDWKD